MDEHDDEPVAKKPKPETTKTTRDHEKEKNRLKKLLAKKDDKGENVITYRPIGKELVTGETFEELYENGTRTFHLKCCNPICAKKEFNKMVKSYLWKTQKGTESKNSF